MNDYPWQVLPEFPAPQDADRLVEFETADGSLLTATVEYQVTLDTHRGGDLVIGPFFIDDDGRSHFNESVRRWRFLSAQISAEDLFQHWERTRDDAMRASLEAAEAQRLCTEAFIEQVSGKGPGPTLAQLETLKTLNFKATMLQSGTDEIVYKIRDRWLRS